MHDCMHARLLTSSENFLDDDDAGSGMMVVLWYHGV